VKRLLVVAHALILAMLLAPAALANGTPVKIDLTKINGITNFGSPNAKGIAEITVVEGDTKVTVTQLDRLTNELYQAWLTNTKTGERVPVGKFNTTADGTAVVTSVVTLGNKEYDLFVITAESEPDPSPDADSRIVLAGYWPKREPAATQTALANLTPGPNSATPGAAKPEATPAPTTPTIPPPTGLPRTGGPGIGVLAFGLATLGASLWIFGRSAKQ
jgi:hypothetical protein